VYRIIVLTLVLSGCAAHLPVFRGVEPARQFRSLNELLYAANVTAGDVSAYLAALPRWRQVNEATRLDAGRQEILWTLAAGNAPYTPADLVAPDAPALVTVPYRGQNNQLAYRRFQKVFYRQHDGTLAGFNVSGAAWFAGPGYYTVATGATGLYVDYTKVPTERPAGQAEIEPNGFPVYGGMQDYLRRVYGDVLIGRAFKNGEATGNYFVLAR
jgi:hypothetical protein